MFLPGDAEYGRAPRNGSVKIYRTLTEQTATKRELRRYMDMLRILPPTYVKEGLVGRGLFVAKAVSRFGLSCEYTGNRVSGYNSQRLDETLEYHRVEPQGLFNVTSEHSIIDPRVVGTEGQYVNHSCQPNARLVEVDFRGRTLILIAALRYLKVG